MNNDRKILWPRMIALFMLLVMVWLLWSWLFKPLVVGLGIASCLLVVYLKYRMDYFRSDHFALNVGPGLPAYWLWLGKEIFISSYEVAKIIINPRLPIDPHVIEVKTDVEDPIDQTIFANSVTLTPGSLSLDVHKGVVKIHCLTKRGAQDLYSGRMVQRVKRLGGK